MFVAGGRTPTGRDAVAWAREGVERGAGEILLTSMDRDGTNDGYDLELTRAVAEAVGVPVIASGGAGELDHLVDALRGGRRRGAVRLDLPLRALQGRRGQGAPRRRRRAGPQRLRRPPGGRIVRAVDVALAILGPTVGFGLFALLALRFGAESRPGFDEKPVLDDRPNLVPLPRQTGPSEPSASAGPPPAVRAPAPVPVARAPRPVPRGRPAPGAA